MVEVIMEFYEDSLLGMVINFGVKFIILAISIYLLILLRGSVFSKIPVYLILIDIFYTLHAVSELFFSGQMKELLYSSTALLVSVWFIIMFVSIRNSLRQIIQKTQPIEKRSEAA